MTDDLPARSIVFATDALEPLVGLARLAEEAGFGRVWTTEYPGRDAVARALAIALGTSRIGVGTGIAYAFTRAPLAMAGLAGDVQRLAGGRFALGLGAGTRGVRRWYGTEFDPPAPRLADYVRGLREAWATMPPLRDGRAPDVFAAGLHPVMVRTAVRICTGVLLHPLALVGTHFRERVVPAIRRGAAERVARGPIQVAAWCVTSIDEDGDRARARAAAQLAFYLSTPSYGPVLAGTEWEFVGGTVRRAYDASDRTAPWSSLAALVPPSLVEEATLAGSPDEVARRAAALERSLGALGVTELVFQTVGAGLTDADVVGNCHQIIESLGRRVKVGP
jgi:alkanesulfonate monooxygenase SsuD/methylene tetrahydromethanopterin reductase-like flavin-dependent oxidoreductase (luciferase family)